MDKTTVEWLNREHHERQRGVPWWIIFSCEPPTILSCLYKTPLSDEWLTQGQAECVEFITKKYSLKKLKDWQAISLLESYERKHGLR